MLLTPKNIRELTLNFCNLIYRLYYQEYSLENFKNIKIGLFKKDNGWSLGFTKKPLYRDNPCVIIELPEDLMSKSDINGFITDLAIIITAKLTNSARTINSNEKRSKAKRLEISQKANAAKNVKINFKKEK